MKIKKKSPQKDRREFLREAIPACLVIPAAASMGATAPQTDPLLEDRTEPLAGELGYREPLDRNSVDE